MPAEVPQCQGLAQVPRLGPPLVGRKHRALHSLGLFLLLKDLSLAFVEHPLFSQDELTPPFSL